MTYSAVAAPVSSSTSLESLSMSTPLLLRAVVDARATTIARRRHARRLTATRCGCATPVEPHSLCIRAIERCLTGGMSVPLDQPHYGIGPAGMVRFLRKYAAFRGRASRSEFWWGQLTLAIASLVLFLPGLIAFPAVFVSRMQVYTSDPATTPAAPFAAFADALWGFGLLLVGAFLWLGLVVPWLSLAWRRAQDAGLHGVIALAFLLGGNLLAGVLLVTGLAQYVLGFLDSSARGARYERSATPVLPPGVTAQVWEAERAMAAAARVPHTT